MSSYRKILFLFMAGLFFSARNAALSRTSYKTVPDSFTVYIPIYLFNKDHIIRLIFKKDATDSSADISAVNDTCFSSDFYQTLIFSLQAVYDFPSYANWYESLEKELDTLHIVGYKKFTGPTYPPNLIQVIDINNEKSPEIILQDRDNSGDKNPVCKIYHWIKEEQKFEEIPHFFKGAFYGWDNSGKYIITGWALGGTKLYTFLNKVVGDSLRPVKTKIYQGDQIISK